MASKIFSHPLHVLDCVPVFECVLQLGTETVAARNDLVNLVFRLGVQVASTISR